MKSNIEKSTTERQSEQLNDVKNLALQTRTKQARYNYINHIIYISVFLLIKFITLVK